MSDARLRELYAETLAVRGGGSRAHCVSPEAIRALVAREGAEDARLATLDHVMACGACSREFELLRAIDRAGAESGSAGAVRAVDLADSASAASSIAVRPRMRAPWRQVGALALAASIVVAVGVGVLNRAGDQGGEVVTRGDGAEVTLLAPTGEVSAGAPVTFAWRPLADASRYELEILDAAGGVVFATTTGDTTATLADSRRLAPGAEYRWWVRASDGGSSHRASPLRRLRVRRE